MSTLISNWLHNLDWTLVLFLLALAVLALAASGFVRIDLRVAP